MGKKTGTAKPNAQPPPEQQQQAKEEAKTTQGVQQQPQKPVNTQQTQQQQYQIQMNREQLTQYQYYLWFQQQQYQQMLVHQEQSKIQAQRIAKLPLVGMTLLEMLFMYLKFVLVIFLLVGAHQEIVTKGTLVNGAIRHFYGFKYFVEYTGEHTKKGEIMEVPFDDEVPICNHTQFTPKRFIQEHVSKYRPCLFKDYAKLWPAYGKWQNESYLKEMAGDEVIYAEKQKDNRFAYFTKGARRVYLTFGEFLEKFKEPNRTEHYYYSFEDPPGPLKDDIINPPIMDAVFALKKVTYWHGFGTHTKPHTDSMENMMCVLEGYKRFTIVSPYDREFVYAGHGGLPDNYSPIEFLVPNYDKYPLFRQARVKTVHIAAGDCLYLPAYWWHQVQSSPGVSIGVATWYGTSHISMDVMQYGMQGHLV